MASLDLDFEDLPPLERNCWACWQATPCPECGGVGKVPSDFGEAILNLVAKYGGKPGRKEGGECES